MALQLFHEVIAGWFRDRFTTPTDPQAQAWPAIAAGRDALVAAPTGSGKTLAAFLWCMDRLFRRGLASSPLPDATSTLYVSPLKALGNDVQKNLEEPLREISARARQLGLEPPEIRVAVRTGDTSEKERRALAKKPPHILVTTPESLFILLTSDSGRRGLAAVDTVIVDEIHAIAGDKRGAHLALSLERLDRLVLASGGRRPSRIGLSATQRPIEEVARLLVGSGAPAGCAIVDTGQRRDMDLRVEVPRDELGAVAGAGQWQDVLDRTAELVKAHRSTLVFVNTRRLVERVARALGERLGPAAVGAHHGSLSRATRHETEQRLKRGELSAVVTTASLELGIDVGAVDLVCQIGAPRAIRTLVQRVGRSGHQRGALPKGRVFVLTRDQLLEGAALARSVRAGRLDAVQVRRSPLDILAQQVVAATACEDMAEDELFALCRGAYPFAGLERAAFDRILDMLAEGFATRRGRSAALVHRDRVNGRVRARRGAKLLAVTSGGAIPDIAAYDVVLEPEATVVGSVDEDFAIESLAGDVFQLGNACYEILRIEGGRVRVGSAAGRSPTIPFWRAEGPSRTDELSEAVSTLRADIEARLPPRDASPEAFAAQNLVAEGWLALEGAMEPAAARQAIGYVAATRAALGVVPTLRRVVAERFFDEAGGQQLVLHAPFGARLNRAFGLALRKRFCRSFNFELQAAATDDGIVLSLGPQHSFALDTVFDMLPRARAREVLEQAVLASPMFATRWRWNAQRSLALPRMRGGKKVAAPLMRFRAEDLLTAVFPEVIACPENLGGGDLEVPDHPLIRETLKDCFEEAMDLEGLERLLEDIEAGRVETVLVETPEPSPMSHEILNANPYAFLDDAPLEERRARAVQTRRGLTDPIARDLGALDAQAIAAVAAETWPHPRDPDEVHDALLTLTAIPTAEAAPWMPHVERLFQDRRATRLTSSGLSLFVATERIPHARAIWPDAALSPPVLLPPALDEPVARDAALFALVRGWLSALGPTTAAAIGRRFALSDADVTGALLALEGDGQAMRGRFTPGAPEGLVEWCERGLLARIHRLTVSRLRREIEPVSVAEFMRFLFRWQHVAPGTQLHAELGLLRILGQLQGFEAAAASWEEDILRARLVGYQPAWLDALSLAGEVAWGRLSARAPRPLVEGAPARRPGASVGRLAPIAIFPRESAAALLVAGRGADEPELSHAAREVAALLERRGASFESEIVAGSRRLPGEVEEALCELVAAGRVTADGFQALRSLLGRGKRARAEGRRHGVRAGTGARRPQGRWSLLRGSEAAPIESLSAAPGAPLGADEWFARQLLRRWGVVFRDLLAREARAPAWRDLLPVYRRLEARGELRGGRFVAGPSGEQFALPEALDGLRALRRKEATGGTGGHSVRISTCDPLNLVGLITPGAREAPQPGRWITWSDGSPAIEPPTPVAAQA